MYEVVTDLSTLVVDPSKEVFVDTETGGTKTITKEVLGKVYTKVEEYVQIVTVQVYQEHWDKVKVFVLSELPNYALEYIFSEISKSKMVGHNYGYDFMMYYKHNLELNFDKLKWFDTFYASRLEKPSWQEYSLDKCLTKVLGYDPYAREGLNKKDMQKSFSPDSHPTPAQLTYASVDVYLLPKLYHAVKGAESRFNYKLDKRIAEIAITMLDRGMPVDVDKLMEIDKECVEKISEANKILGDLNVNSYRQVREELGLEYSSDEVTLRIITGRENGLEGYKVFKHPKLHGKNLELEPNYVHSERKVKVAQAIIDKRKNLKMRNFVVRALTNMDENHRITARFSPHAITGRVQPSEENLSQYPRAMKKMWGINKEYHGDKVLIYADYSQLELRTVCAILPERNMEEAYRNKIDLHTYAANNLDVDESKLPKSMPKRSLAKYLNFLMLYGGGVANFQKTVCKNSGVFLDYDVCKHSADDWKNGFSDIREWHEANAKSKGHMDTTIGGRRYKAKNYTDLNNIKVQGSGAEVAKLAWNYLYKYDVVDLKSSYVVNFVHDAFVVECDNDPEIYKEVAYRLGLAMKLSWQEVMKNAPIPDLPMPVDVLVGTNWADLEYETNILHSVTIDGEYDPNLMEELKNGKK